MRLHQLIPVVLLVFPDVGQAQQPAPCPACDGPAPSPEWKPQDFHPLPRNHIFQVPPSSPGAYSLADALGHVEREKPPLYPYGQNALVQNPLFEYNFSYLADPNLDPIEHDYLDFLKWVRVTEHFVVSNGGQLRWRLMDQTDSGLLGVGNNFDLWRARSYLDVRYRDQFRFYIEGYYADDTFSDLPPGLRDVNRGDISNLFVEAKLLDIQGKPAYLRVGRQEMLFGSQALISPSEWGNVRVTFEGVRGFRIGEKWDFDAFWVQPVIPAPNKMDSVDNNINFAGAWLTHRPKAGTVRDFYYLFLDNTNRSAIRGLDIAPYNVHTLGTRFAGNEGQLLYDIELDLQLGERGRSTTVAGAATTGVGWNLKNLPFNPTAWIYYDYASGDQNPNNGAFTTFNPLFPFGHQYFGWLDLVGRQNIHDINAHLFFYPTNWITCWLQYHHFELASAKDALYNIAPNVVERIDRTGRAGHHVGDEFDFLFNFHLDNHNDFQVGYCYMIAGRYLKDTAANAAQKQDPSLFYMMYTYRW